MKDEARCVHILNEEQFLFSIEGSKPLEQIAKGSAGLPVFQCPQSKAGCFSHRYCLNTDLIQVTSLTTRVTDRQERASYRHKIRRDDPVGPSGRVLCEHTNLRSLKLS